MQGNLPVRLTLSNNISETRSSSLSKPCLQSYANIGDLNLSSIICRERNIIPKTEKGMLLETHAIHMGITTISFFRNTAQKLSSRKNKR